MAKILVDADSFDTDVTIPEGGDARLAASVEPAFQKLANRTRNTKNRIDALAGAKTRLMPLSTFQPQGNASMFGPQFSATAQWILSANSIYLLGSIDLEDGDILTNVEFLVEQGNAGASGQMSARVWRDAISTSGLPTSLQLGSTRTFASGAGFKNASVAISSNNVIANETYHYYVDLRGSALAGTNSDALHWVKLSYTAYGAP